MTAVSALPEDERTRTEVEVAADVLAVLMVRKMMRSDEQAMVALERVTQVPAQAVRKALQHQQRTGSYVAPRAVPAVAERRTDERPEPVNDRERRERERPEFRRKNPTATTRLCKRHENGHDVELSLNQFTVKSFTKSGSPIYHYRCDTCRQRYGKARYLSVAAEKRLGSLIRFILNPEDEVWDAGCVYCLAPLVAGQEVAGTVHLAHACCLDEALEP